jgi:hypothetical protein
MKNFIIASKLTDFPLFFAMGSSLIPGNLIIQKSTSYRYGFLIYQDIFFDRTAPRREALPEGRTSAL